MENSLIKVQANTMEENTTVVNVQAEPDYSMLLDCESCSDLLECYQLIDSLVKDVLSLEEEMVRWRQALLKHLSPLDERNLLADIFDNLAGRNYDNKAYQAYLKACGY